MKLSKLLIELNLSLSDIKMYTPYVNSKFTSLNQEISDDLVEKIVTAYHTPKIQKEIENKKATENYRENKFLTKKTTKLIVSVKWYYNKTNYGEYGFVQNNDLGDIFFRKKDVKGKDPLLLNEGDKLIATIDKSITKNNGKLKANELYPVSMETDLKFLLLNIEELQNESFFQYLLENVGVYISNITQSEKEQIIGIIEYLVAKQEISIKIIHFLISLVQQTSLIDPNSFGEFIVLKCSRDMAFELWSTNKIEQYSRDMVQNNLVNLIVNQKSNAIQLVQRISKNEQEEVLNSAFHEILTKEASDNLSALKYIFNIFNEFELIPDTDSLSDEQKYIVWLNELAQVFPLNIIKIKLTDLLVNQNSTALNLLKRISKAEQETVLNSAYHKISTIEESDNLSALKYILNIFNKLEIKSDTIALSGHKKFILWYDGIIKDFPAKAVREILQELHQFFIENPEIHDYVEYKNPKNIIEKIDEKELKNLIASYYYENAIIKDAKTIQLLLFIIRNIKSEELKKDLLNTIYTKSSDYCRLLLFVQDVTDEINYNDAVLYTGLLSSANQKMFFKKIIRLIAEKKLELGIDDLNRILTIDYSTNELSKEIDGVGLDFSLSVILKVITDLKNKVLTKRNDIFELVANQIKRPDDLLVIGGFFDVCDGRTTIKQIETSKKDNDEEDVISYRLQKTDYKPRFSTYCDGRKSVQTGTETPNLCNKSGLAFWWCENGQCYDVCRKPHNTEHWKNYTLGDILTILKIPYAERQIEILLNVINRVNRFLEHLTCRSCKTILRPKGKSKYAFYGVTWFKCNHAECEKKGQEIYLSHCLNGQCYDIIDSRDSVKCKTENYDDECGWYICKNCYSCCSSDKLEMRKKYSEMNSVEYKCHTVGHKDKGVICCTDCGNEMTNNKVDIDVHKQMLNWFIQKKDNHSNIARSGQRANGGKWWFLWQQGNFSSEKYRDILKKMRLNGFNIPDFDDESKTTQLVAEPFNDIEKQGTNLFTCSNCDNEINLSDNEIFDYGRVNAIKKYHNKIFSSL